MGNAVKEETKWVIEIWEVLCYGLEEYFIEEVHDFFVA